MRRMQILSSSFLEPLPNHDGKTGSCILASVNKSFEIFYYFLVFTQVDDLSKILDAEKTIWMKWAKLSHPSAKAPDHWRRKPNKAEMIMAQLFLKFQLNNHKPGGSNKGINVNKKNIVIGVVFHIRLHQW
jgi:hypothetical protein